MRVRHALTALTLLLAACSTTENQVIGTPIQPQESVRYSVVDAEPTRFLKKVVLVEATIDAVCQEAGCWIKIVDAGKVAMVRWEAGCGGEYSFPKDAAGKRVLIQGTLYSKSLSQAEVEHLDEEAGRKLDVPREGYEFKASAVMILGGGR